MDILFIQSEHRRIETIVTRKDGVRLGVPVFGPLVPIPHDLAHYVVESVFVDMRDARQAAHALRAAGFEERALHVLESRDFLEALAQDQSPFNLITSIDCDLYLREVSRGHIVLTVNTASYAQLKQIRDLLAPHHAYLAKYINTWTETELLP